jgi:DNA-3-methyladenine glycosylase
VVARALLGCILVVDPGGPGEVRARLVETEAYLGVEDAASHAHRGPTPRSAIMFGPPGLLYVYFTYGMHHCANLVCEPDGISGAVLLRAAEVLHGHDVVRARREAVSTAAISEQALLRGPGNLCRGLALSRADNGRDPCAGDERLMVARGRARGEIMAGPRIGIARNAAAPLRFWEAGNPAVSRP